MFILVKSFVCHFYSFYDFICYLLSDVYSTEYGVSLRRMLFLKRKRMTTLIHAASRTYSRLQRDVHLTTPSDTSFISVFR